MIVLFRKSWFFTLLITAPFYCLSQRFTYDTLAVQKIIKRIYALQASNQPDFFNGMFPSYREYHLKKGRLKNDDNIFFTGLVIFTLRSLQPFLDSASQETCDSMFTRALPVYKHYKNVSGRPSYNFWQKDPPEIFPNAGWLNLFNKSQALPDDVDDTAILLSAMKSADSTARQAHHLMQAYANKKLKNARASLEAYRNIPAYSTWLGEKMPVDLDVCVLTNVLYLVNRYQIPYSTADSASSEMICKIVANRHYMTAGLAVSPHYNRPPVIIYHIARLMAEKNIPCLEQVKPELIADATALYYHSKNLIDKIILSTSLLRLGVLLPDDTFSIDADLETFVEDNDFVFFIGNIASILPKMFNKFLVKSGIGKFYYYCPAWNEVLVLENMILRKKMENGESM